MVIFLSLLVAIVGVLMYALSANPKLQEIGRLSYACGLLAFLLTGADKVLSVIPK